MRTGLSTLVVVGLAVASAELAIDPSTIDYEFVNFVATYGRSYTTKDEYLVRRANFEAQYRIIEEHNAKPNISYWLGPNKFMDLSDDEFTAYFTGDSGAPEPEREEPVEDPLKCVAPVDWRELGAVGLVKDQGKCGSCWAFSTVGPVEEMYAIKYGRQVVLSEQQVVDCSWDYGNDGCGGGLFAQGYQYVQDHGLEEAADYPYNAVDGVCFYDSGKARVQVQGIESAARTPSGLKGLLIEGPASISLHASDPTFRNYKSGIYDNRDCPTTVNHAVQTVGWEQDLDAGMNYFIVRNSWGQSWGDHGYIKIAQTNQTLGICGMLYRVPMQPIIA